MKLQFYFNCLFFLNTPKFNVVPKSQEDTFFNYTDFVVNYDEGQYIPFFIQLVYNVS